MSIRKSCSSLASACKKSPRCEARIGLARAEYQSRVIPEFRPSSPFGRVSDTVAASA
jgi:hypothetical protein